MDKAEPKPQSPMANELVIQKRVETVQSITDQTHSDSARENSGTWANIRAIVRISHFDEETWSTAELIRPYALIGRKPGCDIAIAHTDLETVHTYLHFDLSGCHAIDLRTRTGMRINGRAVTYGRLQRGDILEVGGFRIRLDGVLINDKPLKNEDFCSSPISQIRESNLIGLQVRSILKTSRSWSIQSPIAFIGSEPGCAVAMTDNPFASRIHGVLVRTDKSVYYVDLASRGSHIDGTSIFNDCKELFHQSILSIGRSGFLIHRSDGVTHDNSALPSHKSYVSSELTNRPNNSEGFSDQNRPQNTESILAQLLTKIQDRHDQAMERQTETQMAVAQLLRQVQSEQSRIMESHLERIRKQDLEIANLKAQIDPRNPDSDPMESPKAKSIAHVMATPVSGPHDTPPLPDKILINTSENHTNAVDTTAWLLDRVTIQPPPQTKSWKDVFSRLKGE